MSRSFPDYMSLHSSLILLPADDEECIGAVCSSCEDEPDSSHPDPVDEGDILMTINGNVCKDLPFDKILAMARDSQYPVTLTFGQVSQSGREVCEKRDVWAELGAGAAKRNRPGDRFSQATDRHRRPTNTGYRHF